jgi:hypothetical protein
LQLAEASKLNKKGKKDFLTGSELQLALDWREKFKPTAIWANRYKEGFDDAMEYLNKSKAIRDKEEAERFAKNLKKPRGKRRNRKEKNRIRQENVKCWY